MNTCESKESKGYHDNFEVRYQGEVAIIELKNNKIKDECGRDIIGVAIGTCARCGEEYRRLMVKDKDDGLDTWCEWCGGCDIATDNEDTDENEGL